MLTGIRLKEKVKQYAKHMRGIAHGHRLGIIYLLAHQPMEVRDITSNIDLAENLVSHHLKQMYQSGWVVKTRVGRRVTYKLNEKAFFELNRFLTDTPFQRSILAKYYR